MKVTGTTFFLGGLALAGFPFSGIYEAKGILEQAAGEAGFAWLAVIYAASSALTGGGVFRAAGRIFLGWGKQKGIEDASPSTHEKREDGASRRRTPWFLISPGIALILMSFFLPFFPEIKQHAFTAAANFQDSAGYAAAVLDGSAFPYRKTAFPKPSEIKSIFYGGASILAALGLAAASLFMERFPVPLQRFFEALSRPFSALYEFQSGRATDYAAWIVFGAVFLCGTLLLFIRLAQH